MTRTKIFTFKWRVSSDGDYFEQGFEASTLAKAKERWTYFWSLKECDCVLFEIIT